MAAPRPRPSCPVARLLRDAGARGRGDLLARAARDARPGRRGRRPRRRRGLGRRRRHAVVARRRGRRRGAATLGGLPAGRGNDFARMLGLPDDPAEARPRLLLEGDRTPVDLLVLDGRRRARLVAGSVYAGVDARAAEIVDRAHWLPRALQYPYAAVRVARDLPARPLPGRRSTASSAEYAPPRSSSRTRRTTARACRSPRPPSVDDGLLDVVVIEAASRLGADALAAEGVRRRARRARRGHRAAPAAGRGAAAARRTPIPVGGDGEPLGSAARASADAPAVGRGRCPARSRSSPERPRPPQRRSGTAGGQLRDDPGTSARSGAGVDPADSGSARLDREPSAAGRRRKTSPRERLAIEERERRRRRRDVLTRHVADAVSRPGRATQKVDRSRSAPARSAPGTARPALTAYAGGVPGSSGVSQTWTKRAGPLPVRRSRRGPRRSRRTAPAPPRDDRARRGPRSSVCTQRPGQHPRDDLEVAVRVVVEAAARAEQVVVVADHRPEARRSPGRSAARTRTSAG